MKFYETDSQAGAMKKATEILETAIKKKAADGAKYFSIGLSGGKTPLAWFDYLAASFDPPENIVLNVYWVDERCVEFDSAESNCGNAWRHWLRQLYQRHPGQVRMHPLFSAEDKAYREMPPLDMIFLGMGADGHTASWFPGEIYYSLPGKTVRVPAGEEHSERITMTLAAVLEAKEIIFMFYGQEKRDLFVEIWDDDRSDMPTGLLKRAGNKITVIWSE